MVARVINSNDLQTAGFNDLADTWLDAKFLLVNKQDRAINSNSLTPLSETAYSVNLGSDNNNIYSRTKVTFTGSITPQPTTGYQNALDLTRHYTFMDYGSGWNQSTSSNDGRTGAYAFRTKLVHNGQGDLFAYNASIRIKSTKENATHWIACPAAGLINGTVIGESNGAFSNAVEIHTYDSVNGDGVNPVNITSVSFVANGRRDKYGGPSATNGGTSIGQVWSGMRVQSEGNAPWNNILTATGKFNAGIDLSMPALNFGTNKAAISIKADDRVYFNALAAEVDNSTDYIRENWQHTTNFNTYITYNSSTAQLETFINGIKVGRWSSTGNGQFSVPTLNVDGNGTAANAQIVLASGGTFYIGSSTILKGRVTGFGQMTGTATKTAIATYDAPTISASPTQAEVQAIANALQAVSRRLKALDDALGMYGGVNGIIGT